VVSSSTTTNELIEWEQKRQEERTGRIRAEVKLRKALKQQQQQNQHASNNTNGSEKNEDEHAMKLTTIGTIVSPYTKRMGTPRQGALVPQFSWLCAIFQPIISQSRRWNDASRHFILPPHQIFDCEAQADAALVTRLIVVLR
jgi:hypothetical protein